MKKGAFTRRWFKEIPGFPGYWINKKGRVWSVKRKQFIQITLNTKDYLRVQLYNAGVRFMALLHRVVAQIFCPNPDPKRKTEVNHIDYNTRNPYAKNLEWLTPAENRAHKRRKPWGLIDSPSAKFINETVAVPF